MKPHDKIFEEIRHFVEAKFTELEAMEIPSEYFEETTSEINYYLNRLGEEIDYWAENRKADRSRAKKLTFCAGALNRLFEMPDAEPPRNLKDLFALNDGQALWPQDTYCSSFRVEIDAAVAESKKLAEDKWLKTYQEVLKNVDSDTE